MKVKIHLNTAEVCITSMENALLSGSDAIFAHHTLQTLKELHEAITIMDGQIKELQEKLGVG